MDGSNSSITLKDGSILLQNKYGSCSILMPYVPTLNGEKAISYAGAQIYPTTNGIAIKADLNANGEFRFRLKCSYASYDKVLTAFLDGTTNVGLTNRRTKESNLFVYGTYS